MMRCPVVFDGALAPMTMEIGSVVVLWGALLTLRNAWRTWRANGLGIVARWRFARDQLTLVTPQQCARVPKSVSKGETETRQQCKHQIAGVNTLRRQDQADGCTHCRCEPAPGTEYVPDDSPRDEVGSFHRPRY